MNRSFRNQFTPSQTPKCLRYLIWSLIIGSLASALLNHFFLNSFMYPIAEKWIALSSSGIKHGLLWQLITYPLSSLSVGLSFGFLVKLFFTVYLIWMIGSMVVERISVSSFLSFILLVTIGTGALISSILYYSPSLFVLSGAFPILNSFFMAWTMFYGEGTVLLFFVIPMRIRTLSMGYFVLLTLMNLSSENYIGIVADLTGPVLTYLFAILIWNLKGPFKPLEKFDQALLNVRSFFQSSILKIGGVDLSFAKGKRYDFKTGKNIINDDEFLDAMLEKISKKGKESLSLRERWRMHRIVKRRKRRA